MINYDIRYRRQLIMERFGEEGQKKLGNARVLVIGAGGLGSPIISYLSATGVGKLGIVDHDVIEESNLQRQIIHKTSLLNYPKVNSAERFVNELNPAVETEVFQMKLDKEKSTTTF
ncbi:HesA/MoeB/ThiF family protein [Bacillus cytotoxicus]